jgi:uncharacterized protein
MGLIRFLFFLLILWVVWFMVKNWLRKQELGASRDKARVISGKVVRCKHCDVHLPEQDALRDGDDWFCTAAHKQAWLGKSGNKS